MRAGWWDHESIDITLLIIRYLNIIFPWFDPLFDPLDQVGDDDSDPEVLLRGVDLQEVAPQVLAVVDGHLPGHGIFLPVRGCPG